MVTPSVNPYKVSEYLERHIANKVNLDEGTCYKYQCEIRPIVAELGGMKLQRLRATHVRDAYKAVAPGLRRSEVLGLPWSEVSLKDGSIRIRQTLSLTGKGNTAQIKPVHTPSFRRTLYVSQDVLELLTAQRRHQAETRALMGTDWYESGLVFTTALGTPIGPRNALRSFNRIVDRINGVKGRRKKGEKIGLEPVIQFIRLYNLRHTQASLALQRGMPVEVVSERLGHARVDITLKVYRHLQEAERKQAALRLHDLMGQPRSVNWVQIG